MMVLMVMVATCDKANNKSSHSSGGDRDDQRLEAEENHAGLNRRTVRSEKKMYTVNANIDMYEYANFEIQAQA